MLGADCDAIMTTSFLYRGLALLLCANPFFWMSGVAYAQTLPPGGASAGGSTPPPFMQLPPMEAELVRPERQPVTMQPPPAPVDEPVDADKYFCGPGDVLELNFWGAQNFTLRVTVDLEGRAFVPKVGYFDVSGKTLTAARRSIRESVARFFPRLQFDVGLAAPRTFLVQLAGEVSNPGSHSARAIDRVAAVIARAGGFSQSASRRRIEVLRRNGEVLRADLLLYEITGDVKYNPFVFDGDVVRVPFERLAASITGAVNRAGRYELTGAGDLAELVEVAGGLSPAATRLLPVSLVRRENDDRQEQNLLPFDGLHLPEVAMKVDDAVRIPSYTELHQSVMIVGAVPDAGKTRAAAETGTGAPDEASATRRMPFVHGDSVRTLLERAGGVGPLADLSGSYILRADHALPVDLHRLVMLKDLTADRPIQLGDTLVIPVKRRNVLVEGAVFKPGEYPYNPAFGVAQYLALAGGRSRFAQSVDNVRLVTPNGEMKRYSADVKVEPGTSLVVPERTFSRSEVVQIVLGVASIAVSGVAVVLASRN